MAGLSGILPMLVSAALLGTWLGTLSEPVWLSGWALGVLVAIAGRRWRLLACLMLLAGCAVIGLATHASSLPQGLAGQDVELVGYVETLTPTAQSARLRLAVEHCQPIDQGLPSCNRLGHVRLNWYRAPPLDVGERWRLRARLKPPHGYANPGAFDYQAWLLREGIDATGYVRDDRASKLSEAKRSWRAAAHAYLATHVSDGVTRRWLAALTLGDGKALSHDEWTLLSDTGTTHLMVISGLHVGLVAAWMLFLARLVARLLFPGRWRAMSWPWVAAGLAAMGYACLSGPGPAALRAAIMTAVALWVASGRHAPGVWQGWWLALLLVVLLSPGAVQSSGLWLSFGAVAVLILAWRWRPPPGKIVGLLRTQWLLSLATGAAVLLMFDRLAPLAFVINLVAIPWVTLLLVPLGLLGWVLAWWPVLAESCWWLFGRALHGLINGLTWMAAHVPAWQLPDWQVVPSATALGLLTLVCLLPGLGRRWRIAAGLCLLPLPFFVTGPHFASRRFDVTVHDVGQGELVVVDTAHYRLMFDTGPRFRSGFMPLSTLWPPGEHFDTVIVSHADNDHAGGVAALQALHDVGQWRAPTRTAIPVADVQPCRAGEAWRADGVIFRLLWPLSTSTLPATDNDRSCVLLIDNGHSRVLITGDAGVDVEKQLFGALKAPLDLLVAGHHGSRTSSSRAFVIRARPRHVVFSTGYLNAYHHPHADVVRRFQQVGSCLWNTAQDGAIRFRFDLDHTDIEPMRIPPGVEGRCVGVESAF